MDNILWEHVYFNLTLKHVFYISNDIYHQTLNPPASASATLPFLEPIVGSPTKVCPPLCCSHLNLNDQLKSWLCGLHCVLVRHLDSAAVWWKLSCFIVVYFFGCFLGGLHKWEVINGLPDCFHVQVLGRPGFSIADKKRKTGRIGFSHRIRKEEAMRWFQQKVSNVAACVVIDVLNCPVSLWGNMQRRWRCFDVVSKMSPDRRFAFTFFCSHSKAQICWKINDSIDLGQMSCRCVQNTVA